MKRTVFLTLMAWLFCASTFVSAETVNVVENWDSGIDQASHTATLNDGTVLGFLEKYTNVWYFVGAITTRDSLYVPDSICYNSQTSAVEKIGDFYRVDFSAAPNLAKLSLPKTLTYIEATLPSQITDLFLNQTTPPPGYIIVRPFQTPR